MNDNKNVHSDDADLKDLINDYGSDEELRRKISEMKKQKEEQVQVEVTPSKGQTDTKQESSMTNIVADDVEKTMVASRGANLEETLVIMNGKKNSYRSEANTMDEDELGKTIVRPLHAIEEESDDVIIDEDEEEIEDEELEEVEEEELEEDEDEASEEETLEDKKKNEQKNKIITGVIIGIIALLIIGGIIFGISKFMGKDNHKKPDDKVTDVTNKDDKKDEDKNEDDSSDKHQSQDIAAKISALTKQKETYLVEKTKAEERLSNAKKDLEDAQAEQKALDKDLLAKSKEANKAVETFLNGEYKEADQAYKEIKAAYDALDEAGKAEKQFEYDEAVARHDAAVSEFNRLSEEASVLNTNYHNQSKEIKDKINSATASVKDYKSTIATLEQQIDDIETELRNLQ